MTSSRGPVLVILVAALVWISAPACRTVTPSARPTGETSSCSRCHVAIAAQWDRSPHASAWVGEAFAKASRGREDPNCLPCHAPTPLFDREPGARPRLRQQRHELGVDCNACHQAGCAFVGPYRAFGPHAMRAEPARIRANTLCTSCHEVEGRQYAALYAPAAGADARTCIECHMPSGRSRLTQGDVLSGLHPVRTVRDHAFATWDVLAQGAIEIGDPRAETRESTVVVEFSLVNVGAGHRVPTGEHGYRELRIRATAFDGSERPIGSGEDALISELEDGLEPGVPRAFRLELPVDAAPARVVIDVERVDVDGTVLARMVRRTLVVDAGE